MRSPRILLAPTAGTPENDSQREDRAVILPLQDMLAHVRPTLILLLLLALALLAWPLTARAQSPSEAGAQEQPPATTETTPATAGQPLPLATSAQSSLPAPAAQQPLTPEAAIDKIVAQEQAEVGLVRQYSPLVETYIQYLRLDKQLGAVPAGDKYFLGRAELSKGVALEPLDRDEGLKHKLLGNWAEFFSSEFLPRGFLQMIFLDISGFDRTHYKIEYVRREFLGEVRCLVFDVDPLNKKDKGRFVGRIWVEDQDFHIVRFNGAFGGSSLTSNYFNFDSWRSNVGKNLWLPAFVYSEEGSVRDKLSVSIGYKAFRAQTRLWGYNLGHSRQEQELSKVLVEASGIKDQSEIANDYSPLQAARSWDHQAEDNVTDRLERMGLLAPYGEVDKVLETVANNLEVTNNLDIAPEVRCRVLMTSTLESFTIGHSIVLSRGLIDVLPDEASLAVILAHELGHVVLGHRIDSQFAFFDRLRFDEKETFKHFDFARTPEEEEAARQKGMELLRNSPYKDKGASAQLFSQAVRSHAKEIPNLISPDLGDRVSASWPVASEVSAAQTAGDPDKSSPADKAAGDKPAGAPEEKPASNLVAALPLGGRIKVDPWSNQLRMLKSKPVGTVGEAENTPFQITPFMFYLTRVVDNALIAPTPAAGVEAGTKMDTSQKLQAGQEPLPSRPTSDPQKP